MKCVESVQVSPGERYSFPTLSLGGTQNCFTAHGLSSEIPGFFLSLCPLPSQSPSLIQVVSMWAPREAQWWRGRRLPGFESRLGGVELWSWASCACSLAHRFFTFCPARALPYSRPFVLCLMLLIEISAIIVITPSSSLGTWGEEGNNVTLGNGPSDSGCW